MLKVAAIGERNGFHGILIQVTNTPKGLRKGIVWVKSLAPPWNLIRDYRSNKIDWRTFEKEYEKHLLSSEVTLELMYFVKRLSLVYDVFLLGAIGGEKTEQKSLAKIIEKLPLRSKSGAERIKKYWDKRRKGQLCPNFSRKCHTFRKYKACNNTMKDTEACLSKLRRLT